MTAHLSKRDYTVRAVSLSIARGIIAKYHYAHGCTDIAVFSHGLFLADDPAHILGAAVWTPPTVPAAQATWDGDWRQVLSLSRLVVEPSQPTNAASFLIARSIRLIREDGNWRCLVTYADEWQGHTGIIYRATNWEYMGLSDNGDPTWVDERGRMVARKAGLVSKTHAEMAALGYKNIGSFPKHKFRMVIEPIPQRHRTHQPSLLETAS